MTILWGDLETFCATELKRGLYRYAEDVEITLFPYAIDDGPVTCWDVTADPNPPEDLRQALLNPSTVRFHNAAFDRTVLRHALPGLCPPIDRWECTMAQALAHSLPGALDALCELFNLPQDQRKLKEGRDLVMLFCKPRNGKRATRETHPQQWAKFIEYAILDVVSMREVHSRMPAWNYRAAELDLWRLDQAINDRGVAVDLELCERAIETLGIEKRRLADRTVDLTDGVVAAATQRDKLLKFLLEEHGVELPDMQASTLERRLQDEALPEVVRELIKIRLQASTSSTSKYSAVVKAASSDGRLRGMLQFCGASRTGRWSGRVVQLQNLPRPNLKQPVIDQGIEAIKLGAADLITDNVMELASNAIRGFIVAPPDRKLVVSDLANIEGRFAAWTCGEQWKLEAFRDYDTIIGEEERGKPIRKGPDLYRVAYANAFAVHPDDVDTFQRQIGKVMELMLQYEGGVGAFITGADTYGIDLQEMTNKARPSIPEDVWAEAEDFLQWRYTDAVNRYAEAIQKGHNREKALEILEAAKERIRFGLAEEVFVACDSLKRLWRRAHPAIVQFWKDIRNAAVAAIENPGMVINVGRVRVTRTNNWLRIILPSGRSLCYPAPRVTEGHKISYAGVNPYTKQWGRISTYGGKFLENICQGGSRDVMTANMPAIEAAHFDITLTVHDEVVTECVDSKKFNAQRLSDLLATPPDWATGFPLAAGGFETYRYRKGD